MVLTILAVLILIGLVAIPMVMARAGRERRLVEKRLTLRNAGSDDAKLLSTRFADLFNDQDRIRKHLEKDSELALAVWRAGYRTNQQRAVLFGVLVILPLLIAIGAVIWLAMSGMTSQNLMTAAMVGIVGFLLPKKLVVGRAQARMRRVDDELSLFMQMLRILFDSGLAVEQALRVLVNDGGRVLPEMKVELDPVLRRAEQGLDLESELSVAAAALADPGFTDVMVVLRQMLKQGGSARASLAKMIEVMDSRRLTDMQEKVSKLSAKMTIVMVVFFFPALVILVAGPGVISLGNAFGNL